MCAWGAPRSAPLSTTRMHSSRMRTICWSGRLGEGRVYLGGVCVGVGVYLDGVCHTPREQND